MALRLTDTERANIRAALLAMGPERRARLEGQCFSKANINYPYNNPQGYCVVGQLMGAHDGVYGALAAAGFSAYEDTPVAEGITLMMYLNDAGKLRTRAAVAELLALAE